MQLLYFCGGGVQSINISNKHHAIVFYKGEKPVRLMVINKHTDVDKCIELALSQYVGTVTLSEIYNQAKVSRSDLDLKEKPIFNDANASKEIDVGSCDRWNLLFSMLKGSYTESETTYGNFQSDRYEFIPHIEIRYSLTIGKEKFEIEHECAFINSIHTRLIPIQKNSPLTCG